MTEMSKMPDFLEGPEPKSTGGWMPIETAPKDKTSVLLYSPYGIASGYYTDNCWLGDLGNYYDVYIDATHWMPLPKPPVTE